MSRSVRASEASLRPLAYFREQPDERFWTSHWGRESLERLLAVAHSSELTRFLERYVGPGSRVLEAGCGLGQYVRYFAERGAISVGVDFSRAAVDEHLRLFPDSDIQVAELTTLPFPASSFDLYISIGVIEHYSDFGGAILDEASRVLRPDGALLLSTPYANVSRRLLRLLIERQQCEIQRAGGGFYQFAFTAGELDAVLEAAGFAVAERALYNPGRGVRDIARLVRRRADTAHGDARRARAAESPHGRLKRALLYAGPTLRVFAHMQVVCGRKRLPQDAHGLRQ
jgi:SAM-dependent methyltransferase